MPRSTGPARCHPGRDAFSGEMCCACYFRWYRCPDLHKAFGLQCWEVAHVRFR